MSTIKINTLEGKFFLSGSISLSPLQSVEKDIDSMTNTEIQDTIEGHDIKTLNVEGITALREEYKKRTNKQITKEQVGLGNVDNTADVDKPVSNAVSSAIVTATTDMATKTYVNSKDGDLTTLTTTDKTNLVKAINEVVSVKADKATTLVGYGISDAYTKSEIDTDFSGIKTLYDKNVQAGAGANGWTSDLVVEGGLTQRQINALNKIYHPSQYGTLTHGTGDDTKALQDCADALPNGATFRFDGVAKLSRAVGYHTDIYGTEGRLVYATPGGVRNELTLNGGQACLIFREKKDIVIDLRGAELFTETYAQGIIDLYKCENVIIIGGKLTGGAYIRSTGEYKWIPLDGTTGRGEKGYTTKGFNTTSLKIFIQVRLASLGGLLFNIVIQFLI